MSFQTLALPTHLQNKPITQPMTWIRYTLKQCVLLGEVLLSDADVCEFTADPDHSIGASETAYVLMVSIKNNIGSAPIVVCITGSKTGSGSLNSYANIPASAKLDQSFLGSGGAGWTSISGVTVSGGSANDWLEIWAVPDTDQFSTFRFDRSYEMNNGAIAIPVPDHFDPVATVVKTRRSATIRFSKDFQRARDIDALANQEITVMLETHPDGGGNVSEYIILPGATLASGQSAGDNAMVVQNAEGYFNHPLIYKPGL